MLCSTLSESFFSSLSMEMLDVSDSSLMYYYSTGADYPVSYTLTDMGADCNSYCMQEAIEDWLQKVPDMKTSLWTVSLYQNYYAQLIHHSNYMVFNVISALFDM